MTTKHIALAAALACITTSAQAQVIYLVPGGQYPVVGIAPGPYPIPGDPNRVVRLNIEKAIRRALNAAIASCSTAHALCPHRRPRKPHRLRLSRRRASSGGSGCLTR